ncbi:unnamed protein product [Pylaiella littoralis]
MPPGRGRGRGDWKRNGEGGGGGGKGSRYQRQQGKGGAGGAKKSYADSSQAARLSGGGRKESAAKAVLREKGDALDKRFGYDRYSEGPPRLGWIFNMLPTSIPDASGNEKSGLDMYFLEQDGGTFKATVFYKPYFYVLVKEERYIQDSIQCIRRRFEDSAVEVTVVDKEDLDMPNHLSGKLRRFLKLSFHSVSDLMEVKKALMPTVQANKTRAEAQDAYMHTEAQEQQPDDFLSVLVDAREYDVPYYVRCSIDLDIRVGAWYMVTPQEEGVDVAWQKEMVDKAEPKVLAYDIECTKAPLKFPNVEIDQVFMISYMVDGQGFLIISREVVSEDVENFEYTPKPSFPGPFHIFNEPNEEAVIRRFFKHVAELRPQIIVTYNGDYFDWPFVDERAKARKGYGLDMESEIGVGLQANGEYRGRCVAHMDAIYWVKRDSYLPQGSHGLKAVTKYKLGYDPVEVDPEDMVRYASERPTEMAAYSVSDAVATYYLYQTYVHMFVFSLCTIIPMGPDDVLRKGSGTLCEALLMVEAYRGNIVCPNKHSEPLTKFHDGHLLESETYIGGHVECLETGVFRSDLPEKFRLVPSALQALIDNVDRDLTFAIEVESGVQRDTVSNYDEVRSEIIEQLEMLRDSPLREEEPFIYHLDVAAMYPNIILSNRLQPGAIVNKEMCASCDFNQESNNCKRALTWKWRGDMTPASRTEYQSVKMQLTYENVDGKPFVELDETDQATNVRARLKNYAHKVYKKTKVTKEEERVDTVCMRENPFYVNTVRAFRDRRYDYKIMTKKAKKAKAKAAEEGDAVGAKEAGDRAQVFDSLQLAHKCILNSFYGYVMRKGARWRSMEMAGIVTYTGALLIKQARELVEQIGRPLELDTDGIWCILPSSFPENFTFNTKSGGKIRISYPCVMLNADVHENYTNHQYQDLQDPATRKYNTKSECSIFFEVDGPYRCMVLPSSTEEGKLLKKRYAVFNHDGSLAELKGFELKRRGELEVIKVFQSQVFEKFLRGDTLAECYEAVGEVANQWLDVLYSKGGDVDDDELMELISQNKTMSQTLEDYGTAKGTSQTTARRLADFLGAEMVKDKGLNCRMILSNRPHGAPVTERAVPTAIFSAEPAVKKHYLRKWLKDPGMEDFGIRSLLDWTYYLDRLGNCIRKIITIPAAMQKVENPCPRVKHPDWLRKIVREINDGYRQTKIDQLFKAVPAGAAPQQLTNAGASTSTEAASAAGAAAAATAGGDIEDIGSGGGGGAAGRSILGARARVTKRITSKGSARFTTDGSPGKENDGAGSGGGGGGGGVGNDPEEDGEGEVEEVVPIQREDDFQGWLAQQKDGWKRHREQRKLKRRTDARSQAVTAFRGAGSGGARGGTAAGMGAAGAAEKRRRTAAMGRSGLQGYLTSAQDALLRGFWQVVEIRPSDKPGVFTVFAITGPGDMQVVPITIPRVFYVNCLEDKGPAGSAMGRRVARTLPNGRASPFLHEVAMDEAKFQRNEKQVEDFLHHAGIEGVYELGTPLVYRAILHLGSVARVVQGRAAALKGVKSGAGQAPGFELEDLELVTAAAHPYLHPSVATFKHVYLYHSSSGKRGMVGLFYVQGTNEDIEPEPTTVEGGGTEEGDGEGLGPGDRPVIAKAVVWMVNPFSRREGEQRPPFARIFERFTNNSDSSCTFKASSVGTHEEAWAAADASLSSYIRQRNGPTLVLSQGLVQGQELRRRLPALSELPVTHIPGNAEDERFPALGWQAFAAQRMVQRFFIAPRWLADRLLCARYAHLPLANIGADAPCAMADAFFGRLLRHNRHALWASETSRPDLGGTEGDDNDIWAEDLASPTILQPGAYRNICIELEIHGLAVGSVIASSQLEALEGSQGVTALAVNNDNGGKSGDNNGGGNIFSGNGGGGGGGGSGSGGGVGGGDDQAVASAFRILKVLVTTWLDEVTHMGNVHADSLLVHFYRWVCARQSLLHNAALHRLVHRLMHKVFSRLIAELRRLGACVVFASFQKVIIATNKSDVKAARDYAKFVVSTVTSRDLFNTLQLEPKKFWEQLLFLDDQNYGGIQVQGSLFGENAAEEGQKQDDDGGGGGGAGEGAADKSNGGGEGGDDDSDEGSDDDGDGELREGDSEGLQDSDEEEEEEEGEEDGGVARRRRRLRRFKDGGKSRKKAAPKVQGDSDLEADDDDDEQSERNGQESAQKLAGGDGAPPADRKAPPIVSHWNLAEYLPASVRQVFLVLVSTFLLKPHEKARQLRLDHERMVASLSNQLTQSSQPTGPASPEAGGGGAPASQGGVDTALAVQAAIRKEEANESQSMADFLKDLVSMTLTDKVLETVPAIKKYSGSGPDAFPNKPGASRQLTNPALEFIKSLCHVLSLDPTVTDEVETLRKQALAEVGVRQFSAEGLYRDPCVSFVLPDVICSFCNLCRDLDLCRDSRLMDEDEEERWQCVQCNHPYDRSSIELSLVEAVQRRSVRYQLQDMRCSKCGSVATRAMSLTCPCSGRLVAEESQQDFHKTIQLLRQLALFHSFGWLQETVEHILVTDGYMDAAEETPQGEEEAMQEGADANNG